jgi:hypothetical protein
LPQYKYFEPWSQFPSEKNKYDSCKSIKSAKNKEVKTKDKEGYEMTGAVKSYFQKHEDTLMTMAIIILVDHFILEGALRDKIKATVEGFLNREAKKLNTEKEEE